MKIGELKEGFGSLWESMAEGWQRLRDSAAGALTRFRPGEKRVEREAGEGRWRVLRCAYGSFLRSVPLPVKVRAGEARASYRDGVLRIELPKAEPARPQRITLKVS